MHQSFKSFTATLLCSAALALSLAGCGPAPNSTNSYPGAYPTPSATGMPTGGGLANLLTGQVVNSQEQQLRDNLTRQIILDFPIRVGVVYYQLNSQLDKVDQESVFEAARETFENTDGVKETVLIPPSFSAGAQNFEALRTLGSRFQTDILLVITGSHQFAPSRQQQVGFLESFSNTVAYDSNITLEAIAIDVFTGTLLRPFEASARGERIRLDRQQADFEDKAYAYQKEIEEKAWTDLQAEVVQGLEQLKKDVEERLANPVPAPTPSPTPIPTPNPTPNPTSSPTSSAAS